MGKVTSEKRFSHETYGEKFYLFDMEVARLSDTTDIIPVTASERILNDEEYIKKFVEKSNKLSINMIKLKLKTLPRNTSKMVIK